jgi:hypothetical protein
VTPSLDSFSAKIMGQRWVEYKEEHLFYFTPENLSRLFVSAGFAGTMTEKNYKVLNLTYIIAHFERFPKAMWTQAATLAKKILPKLVLDRPFNIVASGMSVIARK